MPSLIHGVVSRMFLFWTSFVIVIIIPKCMRLFLVTLHHGEGNFFLFPCMLRMLWNLLGLPLKLDTGLIKKKKNVPCVPEKNVYSMIIEYCVPYVSIKNLIWNILLQ